MNYGKHQKYQPKFLQTIKSSDEMFRNKFKLTEKIQQLSSSIYQRSLSPWTRKRNESLIKSVQIADQNNSFVNQHSQATAQTLRNHVNNINEANIGDFLRKIQFTKRKPQHKDLISSPEKKGSQSFSEKSALSQLTGMIKDQEKQLIVYPKEAISLRPDNKRVSNENTVKKHKKKDSSDTLIATVHNFYDPFQHKSKQTTIYSIPKGMVNLKLKIKDQLEENKATNFKKGSRMPSRMQKSFRKNSIDDRTNQENLAPVNINEQSILLGGEDKKSQIVVNSTQRTFFKTHNRAFSRRSITEQTERNFVQVARKGSHQRSKTTDVSFTQAGQSNYSTPSNQAIRRIKMQQKKSRRVKTEVMQTISNVKREGEISHIRTQSDRVQDGEYLYRTFLNYKRQRNGNNSNITKTLNMTFHNKESFEKRIEKALNSRVK